MRGWVVCGLLVAGCTPREWAAVDVSERLGPGEARAGVIADEAALFGGISAEGQPGDVKIYNDRVQFVIQGVRPGGYYIGQGGGVIDADIVRAEGQPGRDMVDEWMGMFGLGRLLEAEVVTVVDSGALGGPAIVHVEGRESPMLLLTGAIESPGLLPDLGLHIATDFVLQPDTELLEVRTTLTATEADVLVQPGDVILGSLEVLDPWDPGAGLEAPVSGDKPWTGFVGKGNDVGLAVWSGPGSTYRPSSLDLLSSLVQLAAGFGEAVTIPAGQSVQLTRWYGVGPDLATLTDAMLAEEGVATEAVAGVVTAPDGPVAGARVNVLVDGAPYTLAITGADGAFSAQVPSGSSVELLAVGRGPSVFTDAPEGATRYGPYGAALVQQEALDALSGGAEPVAVAEGRGVATPADPLVLGQPGWLIVSVADGLPFEVRVIARDGEPEIDRRLVPKREKDAALAWSRDGEVRIPLEGGSYDLVVHRGIRYEPHEASFTITPGEEALVVAVLDAAYTHDGWMLADPHMHASPSNDTSIAMEDRVLSAAAVGLQLHFGTDHDHIADYRPLIPALGLDGVLASVVADEVSPPLRGHLNIYPVEPDRAQPNHGAWPWWAEPVADTTSQFALLRERHGDFVMQLNHPTDSGLASSAAWSPGEIGKPDRWAEGFDAVEVMNAGHFDEFLPFYLDVLNRGIVSTPVGVSDQHGHSGSAGMSATFIGLGTSDPSAYTDDALREAMAARRTIVTRGPFLELSIAPGSTITGPATLDVQTRAPSWIQVDRLVLLRDGEPVETVLGSEATFSLDADVDASFIVVAEGDQPMAPVFSNRTPWAMSSPILLDLDGDGWEPPLPPLATP